MGDIAAARQMLDTFASVGAQSFIVTKTDILQKVKWGKVYTIPELEDKLPAMVRTAATRRPTTQENGETILAGENLIIRPISDHTAFIQPDDLKPDQLARVRPAVFILHATSPGNYQGWIAVSDLPGGKGQFKEFMRRVRKAVGNNDKSASHATRLAGTENFKVKYGPEFPTVTIVEAHPGRIMTPEQLENMGLLAPAEAPAVLPITPLRQSHSTKERSWPDYERCIAGAPPSSDGSGPDRSLADFFWCKMAAQRGWSIEETASELLKVSGKAQERARQHDEGYALITAQNAASAAEQGRQRQRG